MPTFESTCTSKSSGIFPSGPSTRTFITSPSTVPWNRRPSARRKRISRPTRCPSRTATSRRPTRAAGGTREAQAELKAAQATAARAETILGARPVGKPLTMPWSGGAGPALVVVVTDHRSGRRAVAVHPVAQLLVDAHDELHLFLRLPLAAQQLALGSLAAIDQEAVASMLHQQG